MESTSVLGASITPIQSNPQVRILPFLHHSMRLLSNQLSETKAITSNPHPLFPLSLTNRLDAHEPLNTRSIAIAFLPSPSPFLTYSHFQWHHKLQEECLESSNLWVSLPFSKPNNPQHAHHPHPLSPTNNSTHRRTTLRTSLSTQQPFYDTARDSPCTLWQFRAPEDRRDWGHPEGSI